ncbi:MAG: hypothetical protein QMD77_02690 [Patescibacteria group bacterium]|nr:hypothetical protein [Patescibacteria group bacterium]
MKNINRKVIIAISFVSVLALGLVWLGFFLQIPKVKELSEAIQKEKLDSFVRQEKASKIFKLKKELADIEDQKMEMEAVFSEKNEAVPFLRVLEKAAGDASCQIKVEAADLSKVKFTQQKPSAKAADEEDEATGKKQNSAEKNKSDESAKTDEIAKLKIHPAFNVEASGSFSSVMDFLGKMENLPYFVRVLILDFSTGKTSGQSGTANAGTLAAGGQAASGNSENQGKNVKLNLLFIVYSNEKK